MVNSSGGMINFIRQGSGAITNKYLPYQLPVSKHKDPKH